MNAKATGRLVGYARVSTTQTRSRKAQHVDNQVQRLRAAGVPDNLIFKDEVSGTKASRPGWDAALAALLPGDVLLVTKLDRIGRSLVNVVDVVKLLGDRHVGIRCLDQGDIDTTTPTGNLIFQIMSALAEWEAAITRERTVEGLAAARERRGGKLPVRGPSISADKIATATHLANQGMSAGRIAEIIGVSRATLYRHVDLTAAREQGEAKPA